MKINYIDFSAELFLNGWCAAIRRAKKSDSEPMLIGYGQYRQLGKFASDTMMMSW